MAHIRSMPLLRGPPLPEVRCQRRPRADPGPRCCDRPFERARSGVRTPGFCRTRVVCAGGSNLLRLWLRTDTMQIELGDRVQSAVDLGVARSNRVLTRVQRPGAAARVKPRRVRGRLDVESFWLGHRVRSVSDPGVERSNRVLTRATSRAAAPREPERAGARPREQRRVHQCANRLTRLDPGHDRRHGFMRQRAFDGQVVDRYGLHWLIGFQADAGA